MTVVTPYGAEVQERVESVETLLNELDTSAPLVLKINMELLTSLSFHRVQTTQRKALIKRDLLNAIATIDFDCEDLVLVTKEYPDLVLKSHFTEWVKTRAEASNLPTDIQRAFLINSDIELTARLLKHRCSSIEIGMSTYLYESDFPDDSEKAMIKIAQSQKRKFAALATQARDALRRKKNRMTQEFIALAGLHPKTFIDLYLEQNFTRLAASAGDALTLRSNQQ